MTKIKPVRVTGRIAPADVLFALRCMAIGVVLFMVWEICQGKV
jgi:hypothetical protein